jgi:hypothetical protein
MPPARQQERASSDAPQPPRAQVGQSIGPSGSLPLLARGSLRWPANLRVAPTVAATRVTLLPQGTALALDAWATDGDGVAWYHGASAYGRGWVYGDAVTLDPGRPTNPAALLTPVQGKGMWFTYALLRHISAQAIVSAARAAGLSHLYVEVGDSAHGFYGGPGLAALLPAAHRAGIRVLSWVYPYLINLPADVALSVAAARYVAPSGDRTDGLLADVEETLAEGTVRAYGQVLRALLGPDELMAIATFPPQAHKGRTYPFATVALSWNVIVPMDYWHVQSRAYSAAEVYQFVRESVQLIRAQTRADEPVEVLGQMFDPYRDGANSPGAAEIAACAAAARAAGAVGVSFFDWKHATAQEWQALAALRVVGPEPPGARRATVVHAVHARPYVVTIVRSLNLRREPLLAAPVLEHLAWGTKLVFRGYHTSWAAVVAPDGRGGYVCRYDVSPVLSPAAIKRERWRALVPLARCGFTPPYLIVTVRAANLRARPTLRAPVITAEPYGTRLALHRTSGAWAAVETSTGRTGWMLRALLRAA